MRDRRSFRRKPPRLGWPLTLALPAMASAALACSTVVLGPPSEPVIAYSYDQSDTGAGYIFVNPAGAIRTSIMPGLAAEWRAVYGSVTVNQFGPGMPAAGMNTAGLVVTLMWNDAAGYGGGAGRPVVNELEIIQRMLDTAGSVDEALAGLDSVDIIGMVPIHFFLADAGGGTATVKPTPAGLDIRRDDAVPIPALTNTSYADMVGGITRFEGFGGSEPLPEAAAIENPTSLERFAIAAGAARALRGPVDRNSAFAVLDALDNPHRRWQVVFRPGTGQIAVRTETGAGTGTIDFSALDFACAIPSPAMDLAVMPAGDLAAGFVPIGEAELADTLRDVLGLIPAEFGIGPEIAREMAAGQLAAMSCGPE